MEQVTHGVDEIHRRFPPVQRLVKPFRENAQLKPVVISVDAHGLKPLRHGFGITVLAPRRNLGATRSWVPRLLSPLNLCRGCHRINRTGYAAIRATFGLVCCLACHKS